MKKRHLFICDTPFQIMMVLAFRMTMLKEETVELIVSDIITNSERLYDNIKNSHVFDKTYYLRDYQINYGNNSLGEIHKIKRLLNRKKAINSLLNLKGSFDAFYASDTLPSIEWIYEILIKRNRNMEMYYYEEGPIAVLCDQGIHFKNVREYGSIKMRLLDMVMGVRHINGHYTGAYVSVADQMEENYFKWLNLPQVPQERLQDYVEILNRFWNYKLNNQFKDKVIFLEESFYTDNRENRDMAVIADLIEVFDKGRVKVKLHPRTRENRFTKIGVETYKDTTVPWELIALNGGLEGTILVCMGSGAIMYPKLYWNIDQCSIALLECEEYHFEYLNNEYYKTVARICRDKNLAFVPKTKREFFEILEKNK